MANISGTIATYFDPSNPAVAATFAGSMGVYFSPSNPTVSLSPTGTLGVYIDSTKGTINVQFKTGTLAVSLDPGYTLGAISNTGFNVNNTPTITGITNSINVYLGGTAGTIRIGDIPGSVAVYFSPSNPAVSATFSGTVGVNIGKIDGTIQTIVGRIDDTVAIKGTLTGITNSIAIVPVTGSGSTLYDETADAVRVLISGSHAAASLAISGTLTGITNSINVYIGGTGGTLGVMFSNQPSVMNQVMDGTTPRNMRANSDGAIKVYDLAAGTVSISNSPTITGITNSIQVFLPDTGHTLGKVDQGVRGTAANAWFTQDIAATAVVSHFAAGQVTGVSVSGNTIAAPAASASRKVYAYHLTSSATLSNIVANFTNGAGTTPTKWSENWLNGTIAGNAVTPPGYLFATGANVTLALLISNAAGPVHYSIYWFNESA